MFLRMPYILVTLQLLTAAAGQQEPDEIVGTFLQEDFFFTPENNNDHELHGHLRRQLQQSCRPLTYESKHGDCSGTYRCTCNGVETDCPYCEIETSSVARTVCQQSGTSSTFTFDRGSPELRTCTCNYYGSGAAVQTCGPQAPPDTAVPPPAPAPSPGDRVDENPSPGVPVNPSTPLVGLSCHALWAFSPRICIGPPSDCPLERVSCSIMGTHPCVCESSFDTQCSYCQVQTTTETFCQVVGSAVTITAPNGSRQTCTCDYAGSGHTVQNCTPNPPAVPAPPVPAPVPVPAPAPGDREDNIPSPEVPIPSLTPLGCHAMVPYNPRICIGGTDRCSPEVVSCAIMGQHSCACTGSSDTMCSYCQVQTNTEMFCQVVGSSSTFTGVDGVMKTCRCDYGGNNQAVQTCTPFAMGISEMP